MNGNKGSEKPDGLFATVAAGGTWDQAIARTLVRPLVGTSVTPNQITTLRLLIGLAACALLAAGENALLHVGAGLFLLSNLTDHADGELARMTGRTSRFGHFYDLVCDALVHTLVFAALGFGLRNGALGDDAIWLGGVAGIGVGALFWVFGHRYRLHGRGGVQPRCLGFDLEDVLYLVVPAIWLGGAVPLLIAAAVGAPIGVLVMVWQHRRTLFVRDEEGERA